MMPYAKRSYWSLYSIPVITLALHFQSAEREVFDQGRFTLTKQGVVVILSEPLPIVTNQPALGI